MQAQGIMLFGKPLRASGEFVFNILATLTTLFNPEEIPQEKINASAGARADS